MQNFYRVAQAENVGQSDIITSEPFVLPKTNPHVKYQCYTMYSTREMDLFSKHKTLTRTGRTDGQG